MTSLNSTIVLPLPVTADLVLAPLPQMLLPSIVHALRLQFPLSTIVLPPLLLPTIVLTQLLLPSIVLGPSTATADLSCVVPLQC